MQTTIMQRRKKWIPLKKRYMKGKIEVNLEDSDSLI